MTEVLEALTCEGWHLKPHASKKVIEQSGENVGKNLRTVVNWAINEDLVEIGEKYIQEALSSSADDLLVGPCVLQISKIRNVSAPKENEYSNIAPRMLKISLTDGSSTVNAIEYGGIDHISLKTPPGTKVKLTGTIVYSSGLLQLQPGCIKVLGGKVEKLYTRWKIACESSGLSRAGVNMEGGPPPFVAFGKRVDKNKYKQGTKSLTNNVKDENGQTEFDEQRKAAIAEVDKPSAGDKKFGSDVRASFGKRPDVENEVKKSYSARTSHYTTEAKRTDDSHKPAGFYRELSTDSGQNVHEKTLKEFVQMGFKHQDVVFCLRKADNDFERAMDLLLEMSGNDEQPHNARRGPGGQRGSIRGGKRGRGRGRGRSNHEEIEDENAQSSSNSATLFDFLESKMSNVFIQEDNQSEQNEEKYTSPPKTNNSSETRSYNHERGRGRGRRGGHDNPRGRGGRRNDNRREFQPRNSNQNDRPKEYEQRNDRQKPHYRNDRESKLQTGAEVKHSNDYESRHDRQPFQRDRSNRNDNRRPNSRTTDREGGRAAHNEDRRPKEIGRPNYQKEFHKLPPRFTKSVAQDSETHKCSVLKSETAEQKVPPSDRNQENSTQPTPSFANIQLNPPPAQREPTTFGQPLPPSSNNVPSSTYQVQAPPFVPQGHNDPSVHIMLPQWNIGSHCMAKYWEDGRYYKAVITDLHPTAPTAVVQFIDFGNYEEVQLFDLKSSFEAYPQQPMHYNQQQVHQPPARHYKEQDGQRPPRRSAKPAMALYVPPRHREAS